MVDTPKCRVSTHRLGPASLEDLREEFLAHCEARIISGRTVEWYNPDGSPTGAQPRGSTRSLRAATGSLRVDVLEAIRIYAWPAIEQQLAHARGKADGTLGATYLNARARRRQVTMLL